MTCEVDLSPIRSRDRRAGSGGRRRAEASAVMPPLGPGSGVRGVPAVTVMTGKANLRMAEHSSTTESQDASAAGRNRARAEAGYGAVFAVKEFRAIFTAHVLSMLGSVFSDASLAVL